MARMDGRVAVISGAGAGIGRATALRLAADGAAILALDLDEGSAELTAELVREAGRAAMAAGVDVRDRPRLDAVIAAGAAELGAIDAVVANAGLSENPGPAWTIDEQTWQRGLDVNLTGAWHTIAAAHPHIAGAGGAVVITSSTAGIKAVPGSGQYTAAKHAVTGLARTLANELGPRGIRVNTVHPGAVATAMTHNPATFARLRPDLDDPGPDDIAGLLAARHLLPVPWVEPEDVARAIAFLCSDDARFITGQHLAVDAGLTTKVA